MIIGYARVSTKDQNIDSQIQMLKDAGCEKIYCDIASGVREDRPGLMNMKMALREGDVVMIQRTDRLFRSLKNMIQLVDELNEVGASFKSLTEPTFDTTSPNGTLLFQVFAAMSEFERNLISERTKIGLRNARKRKKHLGRPSGPTKEIIEKYEYAQYLYDKKDKTIDQACEEAKISKTSFYRVDKMKEDESIRSKSV